MLAFSFFLIYIFIANNISISMYIMCVTLCLFGALSRRVGALQISVIIIKNGGWKGFGNIKSKNGEGKIFGNIKTWNNGWNIFGNKSWNGGWEILGNIKSLNGGWEILGNIKSNNGG